MEDRNILKDARCSVCGNTDEKLFSVKYTKEGIDIVQCAACSFVFIPPYYRKTVSYTDYKDARVAAQVRQGNNWVKIQRHKLRFRLIRNYKKTGKLFDLGVGWGHFLLTAKMLGYEVSGIEISEQPYLYAKNDLGLPVQHIDFFNMDESTKYDILTMWDVLEHIDNANGVIEKCSRLLNQGGYIVIQVPQIDSYMAKKYGKDWKMMGLDHVNYFSKKTLSTLLEKNGFKVREIRSSFEIKLFIMYTLFPYFSRKNKKNTVKATNQTELPAEAHKEITSKRQSFFNKITNVPHWILWLFVLLHNMLYNTLSFFNIGEEMIVVAEKI